MRTYLFEITYFVSVYIDAESRDSAIYEFRLIFGDSLYSQVQSITYVKS